MTTIDSNKKIQKVRTEEEMQNALANFCVQKHTLTVPPQIDDEDMILSDAIEELLEARKQIKFLENEPEIAIHAVCLYHTDDGGIKVSVIIKGKSYPVIIQPAKSTNDCVVTAAGIDGIKRVMNREDSLKERM